MHKVLFVCLSTLLVGCALNAEQPTQNPTERATDWVLEFYAYAESLRQSDNNGGAWRYPGDINELLDCREPRQALRVAVQLGVTKAEPSSRGQARQLYEACLTRIREPLLRGYIRQQLGALQEIEQLQTELRSLRQTLSKKKKLDVTLQKKFSALEAESKQQEDSQSQIRNLEEQVRTLEAQLQSLTSIEQKLNQEEQQATP